MKSKYTFYILFLLLLLFSCGKNDATYTIETKDGVNYVHNNAPLWGDEPKVGLEFVQKIGGMDATDENYQFYMPVDITIDKRGNIYLLDHEDDRIQKFDKHGKYMATIGRKGQGPGEFTWPTCVEMDSEENLYVGQISGACILVLTNEGKEIRRIKPFKMVEDFCVTHAGNIIAPGDPDEKLTSKNIAKDTRLISVYDMDGNFIKKFGELKDYRDRNLTYYGNGLSMTIDIDDNIYIALNEQNRIGKYSPEGELIFRANRPLKYKTGYDKEKSKAMGNLYGLQFFQFFQVSDGIEVDHKNRIWVHSYKKQKEEGDKPIDYFEFEIFDNDGVLLGKILPPKNFNFMRIFNERLFLVDRKEEMCVYEYKIIDK